MSLSNFSYYLRDYRLWMVIGLIGAAGLAKYGEAEARQIGIWAAIVLAALLLVALIVWIIKRVLALGGTTICRRGSAIIAYDGIYGQALARDTRGRPLPDWQGCRTLHDGEAFFMNWDSSDSFDSRYFGPLPITTIIGRAIPVWTTGAADPAAEFLRAPVSDEP